MQATSAAHRERTPRAGQQPSGSEPGGSPTARRPSRAHRLSEKMSTGGMLRSRMRLRASTLAWHICNATNPSHRTPRRVDGQRGKRPMGVKRRVTVQIGQVQGASESNRIARTEQRYWLPPVSSSKARKSSRLCTTCALERMQAARDECQQERRDQRRGGKPASNTHRFESRQANTRQQAEGHDRPTDSLPSTASGIS